MQFSTTSSSRYRYAEYRRRLTVAAVLSLLAHAFVLSLQFGLPGLGLPGLELPWSQRRPQQVPLNVALSNATHASDAQETVPPPSDIAPAGPPERGEAPHKTTPSVRAGAQMVPAKAPSPQPGPAASGAQSPVIAQQESVPASGARAEPAAAGSGAHVITKDDTGQSAFSVPPAVLDEPGQTMELNANARPVLAAPPTDTSELTPPADRIALEQEQARAAQKLAQAVAAAKALEEQQLAREREAQRQAEVMALQARQQREEAEKARHAQEMEERRLEESRRQEQVRQRAEEAAQQQAAAVALQQRAEQQRLDEERTRVLEAGRREERRLQEEASAKREAMEREARRRAEEVAAKERADAEARRQDEAAARQREQALAEKGRASQVAGMARNTAGGGLAGRALEQARKSDDVPLAPPMPHQPSPAVDPARRRSVLGRIEQDVGLMMYVESWRLKIERNGRLNYKQSLVDSAYTEPIITVVVRSDGSVDDIVFHRSSGRPELDEAVRRIIRLNARYAVFPPELARRYDVIEIRRQWNFDDKLRLLDEVR